MAAQKDVYKRQIIVCPASLIYNWQHELELFASNLRIQVVAGNAKERKELIEQYTSYDVLITSYDLLRRDLEIYEGCKFFYQILDEAQYIDVYKRQLTRQR